VQEGTYFHAKKFAPSKPFKQPFSIWIARRPSLREKGAISEGPQLSYYGLRVESLTIATIALEIVIKSISKPLNKDYLPGQEKIS